MTDPTTRIIRFISAQVRDLDDGSCEAVVELAHAQAGTFSATARGPATPADRLRAVARATSDALSEAFDAQGVRVRVVAVHPVESLTRHAILVTLAVTRGADQQTLLGICDVGEDPVRASALAVLNATNRFLDVVPH
jgi:hypothetical protein